MCCPSCRRRRRSCGGRDRQIRSDLEDFFGVDGDEPIELWAWVGAYDHVVLCQLWGPMTALPPAIPRFTRELRQFWEERGSPRMPPRPRDAHDALVDARHNLLRFQLMTTGELPAQAIESRNRRPVTMDG